MAYTDESVKAKLSALNETQESIVTVAQWVLFHRRHAEKTAQLWLQRLKDSGANKRLNLIYLANEVVQQSKARRKEDFLIAFSPIIADAAATAYKGSTNEVQQKLRRVIEVWRQRQIFELPIQDAIEARIDELDKNRSSGKKPALGGSLFSTSSGPSAPMELQPLVPLQLSLSKASMPAKSALSSANSEYDKLMDPATPAPTPPVHAARLSALLKALANAEGAVTESIKARRVLIDGLEKILDTNRAALNADESEELQVSSRKAIIEAKKREVEDGIMRGLSAESSPAIHGIEEGGATEAVEPERPMVEELTPPPVEALTPTGTPPPEIEQAATTTTGADIIHETQPDHTEPPPAFPPPLIPAIATANPPGSDLLSSLAGPFARRHSGNPPNGTDSGSNKRRRVEENDDFAAFGGGDAMDGLDADVAEMLRRESAGR
ncbi:DUF618-domain-containing protein [Xylona heveae TC161]|uniref:DUF618-domain-containing protein n=1 Tax=Xylona heveae (strain CBS 132557 / TC161) TaxID=1328760 RepID=A0A165G3X1_XYLHT|nr:DUF618-domain-containing protein [Xylona heveae TC161]KZF21709.1 DUF618-domain-containing protein [Xylona heveae TC161]